MGFDAVGLDVALLLGAVEDVVGRGMHDGRSHRRGRRRDVARAVPVRVRGLDLVLLRAVHVGPRRAVDDRAGIVLDERLLDGRAVGDVEVGAGEHDRLVPDLTRRALDVAAEHPGPTGDHDSQWSWISELSPTMNRYALGSELERVIATLRPIRLASMR